MLLAVFFALLLLAAVAVVMIYNRLVRMRNVLRAAWADIDVFLKKRYNLVDNLVEIVKGYASHEKETLEKIVAARSRAMGAASPGTKADAENLFTGALKSLFALSEAYPDLKADGSFLKLQDQIQELENGIEHARRYYNATVRDYNTMMEVFPANLVAAQFSFHREEFFELEEPAAREPVKVDFGTSEAPDK